MCGRFNVHDLSGSLLWLFDMSEGPSQPPRYNIAPSQPVAAVRVSPQGGVREALLLRWGLVPFWAKDAAIGARMINARAETVAEKPSFRTAFRQRRCLVPAHGYYEWRKEQGGKQPYHIHMKGGEPFALAGLWEHWEGADGEVIESCALITTEANALTRTIHNRMPVIIDSSGFDAWLDPAGKGAEAQKALLRPYAAEERMVVEKVSTEVNSTRNDHSGCIEPVACG